MLSEARKRANKKWKDAHTETISVFVRKGVKKKVKARAEEMGLTLSNFCLRAITEKMVNDGFITADQVEDFLREDLPKAEE